MTLFFLTAADLGLVIIPEGYRHHNCGRCAAVLLVDGGVLDRAAELELPIRCIGCAAIEGDEAARELHQVRFGCEPEEREPRKVAAAVH